MDTIEIEFVLTAEDLAESHRVATRRRRKATGCKGILGWVVVLMMFGAGIFLPKSSAPSAPTVSHEKGPLALVVIPWAMILAVVAFFVIQIRRKLQPNPLIGESFTVAAGDNGVRWTINLMTIEYQWPAIHAFDESANLFVLYLTNPKQRGDLPRLIVPKRNFSSGERLVEMRSLLESNVHSPHSGFPVAPLPVVAVEAPGADSNVPKNPV